MPGLLSNAQLLAMPTIQDVYNAVSNGTANTQDITAWEILQAGGTPGGGGILGGGLGGAAAAIGGTAGGTPEYLAELSPFAYYAKQRGIPGYGLSPLQQWQQSQFNPLYGTYMAQNYLTRTTPEWGTYLGGAPADYGRQQALGAFRQAAGMPGQEQQGFIDVMGDYFNDFMYNALRQMFAPPIAQRLASRVGGLETQYMGETGGAGNTFLSYLRQKYGI